MGCERLNAKLQNLVKESQIWQEGDGIYSSGDAEPESFQSAERIVRERDAAREFKDYLSYVSTLYSIPVMDKEVERFLTKMPADSLLLDIGGCFGWHWRNLSKHRPDIGVVIVDFIRNNLRHAKNILADQIGATVILVHANALSLPFPTASAGHRGFDGVWTVQTFQHIPNFEQACMDACRVLAVGGFFVCYSMQAVSWIRLLYRLLGKKYHISGLSKPGTGQMYLNRADKCQEQLISEVFKADVNVRYTECLFHPDVKITFPGKENSLVGKFDAWFGGSNCLNRLLARQRSFEVLKEQVNL